MFSSVYVITSTNRAGVVKQLFINFTMYDYITVLLSFGQNHWWQTDLNKVAFEGGPPPLKLGKVNDKLTCLGKNNDKNQVYPPYLEAFCAKQRINLGKNYEYQGYPPYLEAFGGKTTHKYRGRIMIFCNFMHPWWQMPWHNWQTSG